MQRESSATSCLLTQEIYFILIIVLHKFKFSPERTSTTVFSRVEGL